VKAVIPLALASVLIAAAPGLARADDAPIAEQIVDAMNKVFGVHPGFRANHAKGIVAEGHFQGAPEAASLSRASLFAGASIPVTIRFSDATGLPAIPDGAPGANPHGMALKFHLPDGGDTDMVTNSLKFFPVASGEDFRDLLLAVAASPPDAPKPTKLEQFMASHPAAPAAFATAATPTSFADDEYYGVNAFILINAAGTRQAVRYQLVPEKAAHLEPADAAKRPADFLMEELPARLQRGPVTFHLKAQLAAPGDPTDDATKAWPADRKLVELGVVTIEKVVPDSAAAEKKLLFLPGQVTDGIEASDDPLIDVRNAAYAVSFARRNP
jgi:catalase